MDDINRSSAKKQIRFSIGSYREEKKKINKISVAELFSTPNSVPPSTINYHPTKSQIKTRPTSLDISDKPLFNNLQNQSSTNSTFSKDQATNSTSMNDMVEKPTYPPNSTCFNQTQCELLNKPAHPPKIFERSLSLEPEELSYSSRVALTISAYEGEPKTPTRMNFLPPQARLSRSSSKSSDMTSPGEDSTDSINSRLQSELQNTLKRSNLKKKHDIVKNGNVDKINEEEGTKVDEKETKEEPNEKNNVANDETKEEAGTLVDEKGTKEDQKEKNNVANGNGNVQKLVGELTKTLTFQLHPKKQ